jgi:hypothetical protein
MKLSHKKKVTQRVVSIIDIEYPKGDFSSAVLVSVDTKMLQIQKGGVD